MAARASKETGTRLTVTIAAVTLTKQDARFACPGCGGMLGSAPNAYLCVPCGRRFPIVLGIADFRLTPDPWIGIEEDREKGCQLEAATRGMSLEGMVRAYWAMTPSTPATQADRFVAHVMSAAERSRAWLTEIGTPSETASGEWLDLGTGTGDLAVAAAEQGAQVIGVDVAFRWLVVARRRASLAGVEPRFVCCNAEHLPFPRDAFTRVASLGTVEHCQDAQRVFTEARRVLRRGGDVRLRTVNRFTLLPEPHVGVWGVGFVPRRWADAYVQTLSGQRYEHHQPLSARALRHQLQRAGFRNVDVNAAPMLPTDRARLGWLAGVAAWYEAARRAPVVRRAVAWTAPLLEASGVAA